MTPVSSLWTATSLQRYRFPIIALTCLAAGATIYYAQTLIPEVETTQKPQQNLHRSNARHRTRRSHSAGVPPESEEQISWEQALAPGGLNPQARDGGETENDLASEFSWEQQDEGKEEDGSKDGESLLLLLYRIADDQSRNNGYVHRGVACDSCNENPIRGIRYCCVNCADHDLCETCESTQTHNRQHLFLKIRIPAPQLGTHKERQPVFYPGKPRAIVQDLRKEKVDKFCRETGYKPEEVDAFWEQFRSMAATEWSNDPDHYGLAIDRPTFDKCFVPSTSGRLPPPNLIYSRIFSYYDTNDDGLIGFSEFIHGLASLKRNNMAERMKRVFKGYDINGDGYVDRKDFLKMFRAYYAHIKELMGDIVASMQDDDDQDARELVSGGQPLSSMFNGPGSVRSGDIRSGATGKLQNHFGDHDIVDDMGAVDEHGFNPDVELDNIISENLEAVQLSLRKYPMSRSDFPRSGRAIHDFITRSSRDELVSLNEFYGLHDSVCESSIGEDAEKNYRRTLHCKLAEEFRWRRVSLRDTIRRRALKKSFYQYRELSDSSSGTPQDEGGALFDRRLPSRMKKELDDVQSSPSFDEFNGQVVELIETLDWPFEKVLDFKNSIYDMVRRGWSSNELASDLDGFSPDPKEVETFVSSFLELLFRMANKVRQQGHYKADSEKFSTSVKSRSSSKVRFGERPGPDEYGNNVLNSKTSQYSENRPFNERWGAFEAPGPETDVGREALFAVTEEALNELLDPLFRLREDLAVRALFEKKRRAKYRAEIIAAVPSHQGLRDVKLYLERYSRRWRQTIDNPLPLPQDIHDETVNFAHFVDLMISGTVTPRNGTRCTECYKRNQVSWVRIGEYCTQTQNHSQRPKDQPQGRRLVDEKTSPSEPCPMCAHMGKDSLISGLYCDHCGQPCSRLIAEEAKIRRIIETGAEVLPIDFEHDRSSHSSSPERELSRNQPSSGLEVNDGALPNESAAIYTDTTPYPQMAHELHSSVTAFNSFDPAHIEATIASTPLNELLAESGYTSTETDPPFLNSAAPDPTLPQNRPNAIPSSNQASSAPQSTSLSSPLQSALSSLSSQPTGNIRESSEPRGEKATSTNTDSARNYNHDHDPGPNPNLDADPDFPTEAQCKFYACLDLVEAEDRERGGPGRINYEEFEEIMTGEKGGTLGFLASWVEVGAF